ncbi:hypothetical protein MKX03_014146 [Papaver bracteatum]|nr:hypothetical protein MKX03_014146 [Papaver bracteatum]
MGFSSSFWLLLAIAIALPMILQIQTAAAQQPGICTRSTDENHTFRLDGGRNDCTRCRNGCTSNCQTAGAQVGESRCGVRTRQITGAFVGLVCTCCCRRASPSPPPPPPAQLESPPPPLDLFGPPPSPLDLFGPPPPLDLFEPPPPPPSTTTPDTNNFCSPRGIYIALRQFEGARGCVACATLCEDGCPKMATGTYSLAEQRCKEELDLTKCECCCENNTSPPPPPPPSPPPPAPVAPPPPPNTKCADGERYISIQFSDTTSCSTCATDCQRRCSTFLGNLLGSLLGTSPLSSQSCKVDPASSSELCECCCRN